MGVALRHLVLGGVLALVVGGQEPSGWWRPPSDVRAMLRDVSASSLERYDRDLVGFGTRRTLSSQTDPQRGIGAARDYIRDEFQKAANTSGGRMSVETQSYVQPPADRIPAPTTITNVFATLKGSDPKSADRVYVVSGHDDSRVTDVMNSRHALGEEPDLAWGSRTPLPPFGLPTMSMFRLPWMFQTFSLATSANTIVASVGRDAITRASSSTAEVPEASSLAPGASEVELPRRPRRPRGGERSGARTTASRASSRASSRRRARTIRPR